MSFFNVANLIGGLCLFLFGMTIMGQVLERRAGNGLEMLLGQAAYALRQGESGEDP